MSVKQKLIVIGNGMAAGRMLEILLQIAPHQYDVTILAAEPRVNYNRIMLSQVLSGEACFDDTIIHSEDWYESHGVALLLGQTVIAIAQDRKIVRTEAGLELDYDKLVIATGSSPFLIPVEGADLPGVLTFRDADDVGAMVSTSRKGGHAVIVGGGVLGLEAAAGLRARDMDVTVVHLKSALMDKQLDAEASELLERALSNRGIRVRKAANTRRILEKNGHVCGVELESGETLPASMVVVAAGIRPNVDLAKQAGLSVSRGIVVDTFLRTSAPDIFAVGECAEIDNRTYGLVAPLYEQADVLARKLAGEQGAGFHHSIASTKLKVSGVETFSVGDVHEVEGAQSIIFRDVARDIYKRLLFRDDMLVGAVLFGDTQDSAFYSQLVVQSPTIAKDQRDYLVFGRAFTEGVLSSQSVSSKVQTSASPPPPHLAARPTTGRHALNTGFGG